MSTGCWRQCVAAPRRAAKRSMPGRLRGRSISRPTECVATSKTLDIGPESFRFGRQIGRLHRLRRLADLELAIVVLQEIGGDRWRNSRFAGSRRRRNAFRLSRYLFTSGARVRDRACDVALASWAGSTHLILGLPREDP